jgi:hypothetical protein
MKKLKLNIGDLDVASFTARDEEAGTGTVNAMNSYYATCVINGCPYSYYETECECTDAAGCYPSLYCSQGGVGPGQPYGTCYAGCMTNENGQC